MSEGEQVFIPERYVSMLELLVEVPGYGKGILIYANELSKLIKLGRLHANVVLNHDLVYVIEKSSLTPPEK